MIHISGQRKLNMEASKIYFIICGILVMPFGKFRSPISDEEFFSENYSFQSYWLLSGNYHFIFSQVFFIIYAHASEFVIFYWVSSRIGQNLHHFMRTLHVTHMKQMKTITIAFCYCNGNKSKLYIHVNNRFKSKRLHVMQFWTAIKMSLLIIICST